MCSEQCLTRFVINTVDLINPAGSSSVLVRLLKGRSLYYITCPCRSDVRVNVDIWTSARVGLVIVPKKSLVDYADFLISKELTV